MGSKRRSVVDRFAAGAPVDLEDRQAFEAPIRFDIIEANLHLRTRDGRWSLHRRRTGNGPIGQASCWDLVDNADARPTPHALGTSEVALAIARARAHIRRRS
ncbi:hypothetical protein [Micromonospora thermarum]|uniref:Uncharacterized protein n=1 Tax=Micromonospora thermarum TaxID=2720024 RepID=A0ABX0ZCN1_9ACTN|nr:hypothetical protein [Micromonospora thermarum]NJP33720.1 hypothetical protein [Micromonospora thermarum]